MSKVRQQQFQRLDSLEESFRSDLIRHLQSMISGGSNIFCTPATNPFPELKHHTSKVGQVLYDRAQEIVRLAVELKEPQEDLVVSRYLYFSGKWGDLSDHQRLGPRKLAAALLEEVQTSAA